jgi:hercynylcysteine S-oxide lyase
MLSALDFRQWLGGEEKINAYYHLAGGKRIAEILGTDVMHGKGEDELTLDMVGLSLPDHVIGTPQVNGLLPIPPRTKYTQAMDQTFRKRLLNNWNTYVAHLTGRMRCGVQI